MLSLSRSDQKILFSILSNFNKKYSMCFYAFGSRALSKSSKYSDLDLLIENGDLRSIRKLKNKLSDSNLTITVDCIDKETIDDSFYTLIENDLVDLDIYIKNVVI